MGKDERKTEDVDGITRQREGTRPDLATPAPRKRLPEALQKTVDNEEKLWETTVEGRAQDTTDTNARYAAYTSRIRTIMMSAHRYVAYTSDIGESFRPVAHPYIIRGAYGISWLYIAGDVANEGYKAYIRNQKILHPETGLEEPSSSGIVNTVKNVKNNLADTVGVKAGEGGMLTTGVPGRVPAIEDYRAVAAQRAVFQSVASMGIPAVTIHSIVRYSGRAMKNVKNKTLRTWGPIGLGIAAVPFLPYILDEPIEHATEWAFYNAFKAIGGPQAVEGRPVTGQKELRAEESHVRGHEKEL